MNALIIKEFQKLRTYYKYLQENKMVDDNFSFKILAIEKAIYIFKNIKYDIKKNIKKINDLPGIGKGIISRIQEIITHGCIKEVEHFTPKKNELATVIGIGDKLAAYLSKKYKITTVAQLKKLAKKVKFNDTIMTGLKFHGKYNTQIDRKTISIVDNKIKKILKDINIDLESYICGSYRRGLKVSHDIDVIITHPGYLEKNKYINAPTLNDIINTLKQKKFITGSLNNNSETKFMGFGHSLYRIDIRYIPYKSLHYALLYFTGSKTFNQNMRSIAKKKGFTLNEYGLFKDGFYPASSEKDIFNYLEMEYIEPEKRSI